MCPRHVKQEHMLAEASENVPWSEKKTADLKDDLSAALINTDQRIKEHPKVDQTRLLGVIYAIDLKVETDRYGGFRDQLFDFFMQQGVFLRPLGRTVYILPPFTIKPEQLDRIHSVIEKALDTF